MAGMANGMAGIDLYGICRCCHNKVNALCRRLDLAYIYGDIVEDYSAMLLEAFDIRIEPFGGNTFICEMCIQLLKDAWRFMQQVFRCENRFEMYRRREIEIMDKENHDRSNQNRPQTDYSESESEDNREQEGTPQTNDSHDDIIDYENRPTYETYHDYVIRQSISNIRDLIYNPVHESNAQNQYVMSVLRQDANQVENGGTIRLVGGEVLNKIVLKLHVPGNDNVSNEENENVNNEELEDDDNVDESNRSDNGDDGNRSDNDGSNSSDNDEGSNRSDNEDGSNRSDNEDGTDRSDNGSEVGDENEGESDSENRFVEDVEAKAENVRNFGAENTSNYTTNNNLYTFGTEYQNNQYMPEVSNVRPDNSNYLTEDVITIDSDDEIIEEEATPFENDDSNKVDKVIECDNNESQQNRPEVSFKYNIENILGINFGVQSKYEQGNKQNVAGIHEGTGEGKRLDDDERNLEDDALTENIDKHWEVYNQELECLQLTSDSCVHVCKICGNKATTRLDLAKHFVRQHREVFKCSFCSQFCTHNSYLKHVQTHLTFLEFECQYCTKLFTRPALLNHVFNGLCPNKIYVCDICHEPYYTKMKIRRHILNKHMAIPFYKCSVCGERFVGRQSRNDHIMLCHERELKCEICLKIFKRVTTMRRHIRQHHKPTADYTCKYCNTVISKRKYSLHVNACKNLTFNHICSVCSEVFPSDYKLRNHLKIHTGE